MTISNGSAADANDVLVNLGVASDDYNAEIKVLGYAFQTEAQNRYAIIYDSDVSEFNTLQADEWVAGFQVLSIAGDADTGNTTMKYNSNVGYFTADLLDDFEDASIDSAKWTTTVTGGGTVTEADGLLKIDSGATDTHTAAARTQGSGPGFDGKIADSTLIVETITQQASGDTAVIRVSNGTTTVNLLSFTSDSGSTTRFIEIYFDTAGQTARTRIKTTKSGGWGLWSATTDISSVTSNWYVEFINTTSTNGGSGFFHLEDVWTVQGAVTQVFQSNGYDHLQTSTDPDGVITLDHGIFTVNKDFNGATPTWSLSTDNGSNFSTLNENEVTTIGNASNQLVLKGSIQSASDRPAYIYEFGVKAWD